MSYQILGRAVKSEYLTLGTLFSVGAITWAATGGKKETSHAPKTVAKTVQEKVQQVKDAVPLGAGSSEEEQFIKKFIEEEEAKVKH